MPMHIPTASKYEPILREAGFVEMKSARTPYVQSMFDLLNQDEKPFAIYGAVKAGGMRTILIFDPEWGQVWERTASPTRGVPFPCRDVSSLPAPKPLGIMRRLARKRK